MPPSNRIGASGTPFLTFSELMRLPVNRQVAREGLLPILPSGRNSATLGSPCQQSMEIKHAGDKARFHSERKHKVAKRERNRALREKLTASTPRRPDGRDL